MTTLFMAMTNSTIIGASPVVPGIQELGFDELESINGGGGILVGAVVATGVVCLVAGVGFSIGYTLARLCGAPALDPLP